MYLGLTKGDLVRAKVYLKTGQNIRRLKLRIPSRFHHAKLRDSCSKRGSAIQEFADHLELALCAI